MRLVVAPAAAALVLLLSGCSEPVDGVVALQRVGEHVHVDVEACPGHSVDKVTLREVGGMFRDEWKFEEAVTESGSIDIGVFADSVTLLDTGHPYQLGTASTDDSNIWPVEFWADQLAALQDAEYLTVDGAKDESAFQSYVEDRCGPR